MGLDTAAAEEATLVPSDEGSPARKLEEEKGVDAQSGGCPGWDSHQKELDDKCDAGQIMCFDENHLAQKSGYYCHKVGLDTATTEEATPVGGK